MAAACEFPNCRNEGRPCPVCGKVLCDAHSNWHYHTCAEIRLKFGGTEGKAYNSRTP
jgi:hypothetical protein